LQKTSKKRTPAQMAAEHAKMAAEHAQLDNDTTITTATTSVAGISSVT
jgi:hypothetical protein